MSNAPQSPPRRARLGRRLLLFVVASGATLLVLELGLRVWAAATSQPRGVDFDPVIGWHMLPRIEKVGEFWSGREPGRTNSRGWRDAERALTKPAGVRRIVALGDSFTFGQGVDPPERFTELLADELGCEVVNLGACAYATDQQLLVFETEGVDYAPDVVLLQVFLGNDIEDLGRDRVAGWSKPYFRLRGDGLELVPPDYAWTTALRTHSYLAELALQAFEHQQPARRLAVEWQGRDTMPVFRAVVARLADGARRVGARLLVVLVHPCDDALVLRRSPLADAALAALTDVGVPVVDTFEVLAAAPASPPVHLPNLHWSPTGHTRVAALVAARLREHGWLRTAVPGLPDRPR